ncbi:MAG: outer membrane beta-barrel protein, partial [Oscillospiraceae bacterium]|nr:outer membrane beta-barrel protein [Oscillospiraceae bacterium]
MGIYLLYRFPPPSVNPQGSGHKPPGRRAGQLTAAYRSARLVTQGEQKGFFTLDLGLRKTFWDKRLSLAFTVRDILNSRKTEKTTTSEHFKQ